MLIRSGILVATIVAIAGCGQTSTSPSDALLTDDSVVVYEFHDASLPPEYHRSITLTASKDETRIVIDSYGDVLADESVSTPAAAWTQLAATIDGVSALEVVNDAEGCTGGTSVELTVSSGDERTIDLDPEFCGGSNEGIETAITEWIAPIRSLFPPTGELAPEAA